ncbi:MAG: hypothetical protein KC636_01195 [Myxococcales bacterium]|nr:hypothetical protein [Myxococcales bacterium]
MMERAALAALIDTSPDGPRTDAAWLERVLRERWREPWPAYARVTDDDDPPARAWSVGGVHGLETLVQARPVVRGRDTSFVTDLLRVPTQCTLAAFAIAPGPGASAPRVDIARFQRWIGVRSEGSLRTSAEHSKRLRQSIEGSLPGFLTRSLKSRSDRELSFFAFLSLLHEEGGLGVAYATVDQLRRALVRLDALLEHPAMIHLMVGDGRHVGVLHRGVRLLQFFPPVAPPTRKPITGPHSMAGRGPVATLLLQVEPEVEAPRSDGPQAPEDVAHELEAGVHTIAVRAPLELSRVGSGRAN